MKFGKTLDRLVDADLEAGNAIFLGGPSAIGKSSYIQALGERYNTKTFTMNCNMLETKEDINGVRLVPVENDFAQKFFPTLKVTEAVQYANEHPDENPILFGDELNRTTPGAVSALLTAHTDRTIGDLKLPDNLRLIFAGNVTGNISMFDAATVSRFSVYKVAADAETFLNIHGDDLHSSIKKILTDNPQFIYLEPEDKSNNFEMPDEDDEDGVTFNPNAAFVDTETLAQITAPRTIMALNKVLTGGWDDELVKELMTTESDDDVASNLFEERIFGYVGVTQFAYALINEFSTAIMGSSSTNNTSNVINAPSSYMNFESMTDIDDMRTYAAGLNNVVAQQCLMYALTSVRTNAPSIAQALAENVDDLPTNSMMLLMQNISSIQKRPFKALLDSNSKLAQHPSIQGIAGTVCP